MLHKQNMQRNIVFLRKRSKDSKAKIDASANINQTRIASTTHIENAYLQKAICIRHIAFYDINGIESYK